MSGRIRCTVTRYSVEHDGVMISSTRAEYAGFHVEDGYVYLHNSKASAPVEDLLRAARKEGRGWFVQCGTSPVFVDGSWGGRNYPDIHVSAADLIAALDQPRGESS